MPRTARPCALATVAVEAGSTLKAARPKVIAIAQIGPDSRLPMGVSAARWPVAAAVARIANTVHGSVAMEAGNTESVGGGQRWWVMMGKAMGGCSERVGLRRGACSNMIVVASVHGAWREIDLEVVYGVGTGTWFDEHRTTVDTNRA